MGKSPGHVAPKLAPVDFPLAGLGMFGGWIVLVVVSDVFGILRVPAKRLSTYQTVFLIVAIVAALACGYAYLQERHPRPCPPAHGGRR